MLPFGESEKLKRIDLRRAKHEALLRLARRLNLRRDLETMSHQQLAALIYWLLGRREKRAKGFVL
jgi:hypothetical protein